MDEVVVVSGAHELPVASVHAPDWERGPGASLRAGLAALPDDAEAAVVVLADGPDLDPRAVDRVVADWRANGGDVVAATYGGVRLHPVLLARAAWASIPDEGARSLPARLVPCDDLTPPGRRRLQSSGILSADSFSRSAGGICSAVAWRT